MAEKIEGQEGLRKQLTSDVAHELRTPLTNISTQIEMIVEGVFKPDKKRLQGIYDEVNRISSLVSELEKLQSIENNALDIKQFDLTGTAKSTVLSFEAELDKNGLSCVVSGGSVQICADEGKIRQVITNLLSNAIKYSPTGGVIEISVKDCAESARVSVKDNGIGISAEDQNLIFERFYRTDKSRSRKTGGLGIGLTIVSAIVKAHGGEIVVESAEGRGSTFTVILPKGGICAAVS